MTAVGSPAAAVPATGGASPGRLGCYLLPGLGVDPRDAVTEAQQAEELGLASVWIAEKYDVKDLPSLAGALATATRRVSIGAGVTHVGLRHPLSVASMGQTLQALTAGRFRLGFGRAAPRKWIDAGVPVPTMSTIADFVGILRGLWAGQTIHYDGPAGRFPSLRIAVLPGVTPPPLYLAAIGPKMLALAGRHFDGVILHPLLTPEAVARSIEVVLEARDASNTPHRPVRVYAAVIAAPDGTEPDQLDAVSSRASRYFTARAVRESVVAANGWDLARASDPPRSPDGAGHALPEEWLRSASAIGSVAERARRLDAYLAAGADELILHGATIPQLATVVRSLPQDA